MKNSIKTIIEIIIIGIIVFFISYFFFQICFVKGNSMIPTLKDGQAVITQKFNLHIVNNDIIVIKKNGKVIIKRVIGIPKDKISIIDGYVYVNGYKNDERFINNPGSVTYEIQLNDDEYFVLGDNRDESIDSRFDEIGIIMKKDIIGKIIWTKGKR